jgi:AcrR family transcriptional regulator
MPVVRAKSRKRKPLQARAHVTRAAILVAAAQVLARRGYAGTTTNHVAARAGVSIGTLYEYFRHKDELVTAVVDAHLTAGETLLAERVAALRPDAPLPAIVRALVEGMVRLHADEPRLHRVLTSEVPHTRANVARAVAMEQRLIEGLAAVLATRGGGRGGDPALAARICVHVVEALTHRWVVDARDAPAAPEVLEAELVRVVLGYLGAPPA